MSFHIKIRKSTHLFIFYLFIFGGIGSLLPHTGFLQLRRAGATLRCGARASHCGGFSCCQARALGSRASVVVECGLGSCGLQAQQLWHVGLIAPRHVGSSQTRAQTCVPCIGRRILNLCAMRKVHLFNFPEHHHSPPSLLLKMQPPKIQETCNSK